MVIPFLNIYREKKSIGWLSRSFYFWNHGDKLSSPGELFICLCFYPGIFAPLIADCQLPRPSVVPVSGIGLSGTASVFSTVSKNAKFRFRIPAVFVVSWVSKHSAVRGPKLFFNFYSISYMWFSSSVCFLLCALIASHCHVNHMRVQQVLRLW